jgi:hypothetical protein
VKKALTYLYLSRLFIWLHLKDCLIWKNQIDGQRTLKIS